MRLLNAHNLLKQMSPGVVYRRRALAEFSKAVDRDLKYLVNQKLILTLGSGLYCRPIESRWGDLPPTANELVRAFLGTKDFLITSPNSYNDLGLGLTQLKNLSVVYNRKRTGYFNLGGQCFLFKRPTVNYPKSATAEFLFIDLLNNFDDILEAPNDFEKTLRSKLSLLSRNKLFQQAQIYGKARTQRMLKEYLGNEA